MKKKNILFLWSRQYLQLIKMEEKKGKRKKFLKKKIRKKKKEILGKNQLVVSESILIKI